MYSEFEKGAVEEERGKMASKEQRYRDTYLDSDGEERERGIVFTESQGTENSREACASATGLSQDFEFLFNERTDDKETVGIPIDASLAQSIGVVAVVKRDDVHRKQKKVESYALWRTFYAYPKDASDEMIKSIREKMEEELGDFRLQNYTVETYKFGLPFAVGKVGRISAGYTGKPKMLKADTRKRKKDETSDDDEGDGEDILYRPPKVKSVRGSSTSSGAAASTASLGTSGTGTSDVKADTDVIEITDVDEPRTLRSQVKKQRK